MTLTNPRLTRVQWVAAAQERYGTDMMSWRFRCPVCDTETAVSEWKAADAGEGAVAYSCIGRYLSGEPRDAINGTGPGPCNYAGGGLFRLNPIIVTDDEGREHQVFDFADRPLCTAREAA